jgi:hypothetical protein
MTIIEIIALENGAHRNQSGGNTIPEGWAVIPEGMETENFPFGEVEVETINGVPTVTKWIPGTIPEPEPVEEPVNESETVLDLLAEQEYRICMLELGGN